MKLKSYVEQHVEDVPAFAKEIGVHVVSLYRYMSGNRRPEWEVLARIKAATSGLVMADDFMPDPGSSGGEPPSTPSDVQALGAVA